MGRGRERGTRRTASRATAREGVQSATCAIPEREREGGRWAGSERERRRGGREGREGGRGGGRERQREERGRDEGERRVGGREGGGGRERRRGRGRERNGA